MQRRWLGFVIAVLAALASWLVFDRLPPQIPTHWSLRGVADGYSPRLRAALFGPMVILILTAGMQLVPWLQARSPSRRSLPRRFWLVINLVAVLVLVLHVAVLANGAGAPVNPTFIGLAGALVLMVAAPLLLLGDSNRKSQ